MPPTRENRPDGPGKGHTVLSQFTAELLVGFQNLLNCLYETKVDRMEDM